MYASKKSWKNFENVLKSIGRVKQDFDINNSFDNSFILKYFKYKNVIK